MSVTAQDYNDNLYNAIQAYAEDNKTIIEDSMLELVNDGLPGSYTEIKVWSHPTLEKPTRQLMETYILDAARIAEVQTAVKEVRKGVMQQKIPSFNTLQIARVSVNPKFYGKLLFNKQTKQIAYNDEGTLIYLN